MPLSDGTGGATDEPLIFPGERRERSCADGIPEELTVLPGSLRKSARHTDKMNAINDSVPKIPFALGHCPSLARAFSTGELLFYLGCSKVPGTLTGEWHSLRDR